MFRTIQAETFIQTHEDLLDDAGQRPEVRQCTPYRLHEELFLRAAYPQASRCSLVWAGLSEQALQRAIRHILKD